MFTSKAYTISPVIVQSLMLSVRAFLRKKLRENKSCDQFTDILISHDDNEVLLKGYSQHKLEQVLIEASKNTSYYKTFGTNISNYPFIDKVEVNRKKEQFLTKNSKGVSIKGSTSGTTGSPLSVPQNMKSVIAEQAFINRMMHWAGVKAKDKRAWIRGDMIVPLSQKKGPFWRYSYFENMIMLSSFHMANNNLQLYIDAMVDFGVQVIQAYPSSIVTLAKYLEVNNQYYPGKIKSVVTSSESLTKEDKQLIETRFKCTVFDWYGLFERVAAIASCEYGRYHILTDYSYVELLPVEKAEDGRERAEIVGTNYNNSLYPLIRYKTGDHVVLSNETSCPCGRVHPIVDSIEGRVGDYLIGEDGQKVHILNHIPKGVNGIIALQFIQVIKGEITVRVVTDKNLFDDKQRLTLINNAKEKLGESITFSIDEVNAIPRTKNGKIRQAICSLQ